MRTTRGRLYALVVAVLVVAATTSATAVEWEPIWERHVAPVSMLDVGGSHVAVDARGNVYVAATITRQADAGFSATLARYTPTGRLVWRRTWRGHGYHAWAMAEVVAVSADRRSVYVGGALTDESTENHTTRLWAYMPTGERRWGRPVPGAAQGVVLSVAPRADGAVVGVTGWGECGPMDGSVAALGSDGTRRWTDPFEPPGYGGTGDAVRGVAVGAHGLVYAVGYVDRAPSSCEPFEPVPGKDVVVAQLTASGEPRWFRTYPRFNEGRGGSAWGVTTHAERTFVVGGAARSGSAWLANLSPNGAVRWSREWGPEPGHSQATGISASPWGPLYVVGSARETLFLRSYSNAGELWSVRRLNHVDPSGVATGPRHALYVTGDQSLWRMPV